MVQDSRRASAKLAFVGSQAKGILGRDIQGYGPCGGDVMLDGERYAIRSTSSGMLSAIPKRSGRWSTAAC